MAHSNLTRLMVNKDLYWASIPEWVIYADIGANAVRVYATLMRHADHSTGDCFPTRKTIARLCHISESTLDRAVDELVSIGAVRVQNRKNENGDWTSNVYTVCVIPPQGVYSPVDTPVFTSDETGVFTSDEQTRASSNESHSTSSPDGFDVFWDSYPRKLGKAEARKAWLKAVKAGAVPDAIMAGLDWWVRGEWRGKEQRFIPHGSTWLNQQRWADAPAEPSPEARQQAQDASETRQEASRAVFEVAEALGEGRAWRGASEASYRAHRETWPEHLREHLDKGFYGE